MLGMTLADVSRPAADSLVDGRYALLEELGTGECSRVFAALDRETGAQVALKLVSPPAISQRLVATRLLAELRRVAALDHPGAVRVLRAFEWQDQVAIVTARTPGTDLASAIAAAGPLEPQRVVELAREL